MLFGVLTVSDLQPLALYYTIGGEEKMLNNSTYASLTHSDVGEEKMLNNSTYASLTHSDVGYDGHI